MVAFPVIMNAEIGDRVPQHRLAKEDHPVETFGFYRSHEPFGESISLRGQLHPIVTVRNKHSGSLIRSIRSVGASSR